MNLFHVIILALIQGLTEFIPVSSSAHLILPSQLIESWPDQGIDFDIAVHFGTLLAVVLFFRKDIILMIKSLFALVFGKGEVNNEYARLAIFIIIATIPVGLMGIILKDYIEGYARSGILIGLTTIIFGALLFFAERYNKRFFNKSLENTKEINEKGYHTLTSKRAIYIGLAQVLAIIPGTSRSGITMTAGYFLGLSPSMAAKFSFLLSIPTIGASALLATKDIIENGTSIPLMYLIVGVVVSFICAFIVIKLFLDFLTKVGLLPYVIYRLILGAILLIVFW